MDGPVLLDSFGIACPACGNSTQVMDSRPAPGGIKRRRRCVACAHRFSTHEMAHVTVDKRVPGKIRRHLKTLRLIADRLDNLTGQLLPSAREENG